MPYVTIGEKHYTKEEYEAYKAQERVEQLARYRAEQEAIARAHEEGQRLVGELGRAYTAYNGFLKENPALALHLDGEQEIHHKICEDLLKKLKKADSAPRCGYIKVNGVACGSPRMKDHELCYAHERMAAVRPEKLDLPPMEDHNSIQMGLMHVARGLMDGKIDQRTAGLMLYCLQIASSNVGYTNFGGNE